MEDNNEEDLKNKADLHIAGRYTALDIFRFSVFLNFVMEFYNKKYRKAEYVQRSVPSSNV